MASPKKAWYKKWWAISLFIIAGLIILGSLFGGNSPSSDLNIETGEQIVAKTEEVKTYSIGQSIQAGDFKWKVVKSSTATEIVKMSMEHSLEKKLMVFLLFLMLR